MSAINCTFVLKGLMETETVGSTDAVGHLIEPWIHMLDSQKPQSSAKAYVDSVLWHIHIPTDQYWQ